MREKLFLIQLALFALRDWGAFVYRKSTLGVRGLKFIVRSFAGFHPVIILGSDLERVLGE